MGMISRLFASKQVALQEEISELIAALRTPPSETERREGWDADLKSKWAAWFTKLDQQLADGEVPSPIRRYGYMGAARAMDFDGVGRTKLSNLAGRIDQRLNKGERY
jgi:hypothetical protein